MALDRKFSFFFIPPFCFFSDLLGLPHLEGQLVAGQLLLGRLRGQRVGVGVAGQRGEHRAQVLHRALAAFLLPQLVEGLGRQANLGAGLPHQALVQARQVSATVRQGLFLRHLAQDRDVRVRRDGTMQRGGVGLAGEEVQGNDLKTKKRTKKATKKRKKKKKKKVSLVQTAHTHAEMLFLFLFDRFLN